VILALALMRTLSVWTILVAVVVVVACARPESPERQSSEPASGAPESSPASSSSVAPSASNPISASRPRIVFLGDSLTAGLGLEKTQAVPALLQARLDKLGYDYEVVNAGVSGDTSAGGLSRLDWSLDGDVKVLVLELGANDGLRGLPVANMKRNLSEIIARAKSRGVEVLLTGMEAPPNYGQAYTNEFRQVYSDLAREHDVPFMPFFLDGVAGIPALNNPDGVHPNAEGARLVEQAVWKALEPLLEKQS
jgi:acyl-CoA thioesterase I